jgi:hypothetical protein
MPKRKLGTEMPGQPCTSDRWTRRAGSLILLWFLAGIRALHGLKMSAT